MENQQYDHIHTEKKWRKNWESRDAFKADDMNNGGDPKDERPKHYILDMFPYPSGAGLHVGHPEGYTATDIISRYKRMQGYNVLHPMGWDAFGLPAENYAIKTNVAPEKSTRGNIENFTQQIKALGFSYDWEREIATCDPSYYKWTQWFFLLLYKNGLAYKKEAAVNWCNDCMTVLANEQVIDGKCDRCQNEVIQKHLAQWFFRITDFIEDYINPTTGRVTRGLISGLDTIDWPDSTKVAQLNWIGKSVGAEVEFKIANSAEALTIFTTRPDTLFGATFMVIAPEHPLAEKITTEAQKKEVEKYIKASSMRTQLERQSDTTKTGVFTGAYGVNPVNEANIPIYIADYVFMGYGTGAIMAVPAHDERDFEFAKKYEIEVKCIIQPDTEDNVEDILSGNTCFTGDGLLIDSEFLNGLNVEDAKAKMIEWLESEKVGTRKTTFRLRDWLISRQRYWGAPIPIVYDAERKAHVVKEKDLPIILPTDVDYKPKGTSPLGSSKEFKTRAKDLYGEGFEFEIDTMDTFVCSSWYFWRFMDPKNEKLFAGSKALKKWGQVDLYVGGAEHTVLHLLYARFFCKVLHKLGYIDYDEPFYKLRHQGMILGEDGEKMSKSKGNVINPNEIVEKYGADTLRMYEMFMGPFKDMKPWNTNGVVGVYRFVQKVWKLSIGVKKDGFAMNDKCEISRHKTIQKVTGDTEEFKFNTAVSQMMIYVNELTMHGATHEDMKALLLVLGIYAPHMCAELWGKLGFEKEFGHLDTQKWPDFDEALCVDSEIEFAIQVNGKLRGTFTASKDISKEDAIKTAKEVENVAKFLEEGEIVKEIYIPGKLISFVVK